MPWVAPAHHPDRHHQLYLPPQLQPAQPLPSMHVYGVSMNAHTQALKVLTGQNEMKDQQTDVCFPLVWGVSSLRKPKAPRQPRVFLTQTVIVHSTRAIKPADLAGPAVPQVSGMLVMRLDKGVARKSGER